MGADLITYIIFGPKTLDESKKEEAKRLISSAIELAKHYLEDPPRDVSFDEEELENISAQVPENLINALFDTWAEEYRDSNMREIPGDSTRVVVVAGDTTWGDEPYGYAYLCLRDICSVDNLLRGKLFELLELA